MTDGCPPGGPGKPAVGDEGHRFPQPHAADGGGGVEHLPHARAALGPLVADDHHIAGMDLLPINIGNGFLLGIVHPGGAFVDHHLRGHGGLLHHAAIRSQVALQNRDAAALGVGILQGTNDGGVQILDRGQVLRHGLSRAGEKAGVQQVLLGQLLHHRVNAAGPLQVLHKGVPRWGQMAQVGRPGGDGVGLVQVNGHPGLMGDGGQVEHGIGGAAQGHVHGLRIVEGRRRHDVPGPDVPPDQLHDLHARLLGQAAAGREGRGNGPVAGQSHANGLCQAVHGVGGIHP